MILGVSSQRKSAQVPKGPGLPLKRIEEMNAGGIATLAQDFLGKVNRDSRMCHMVKHARERFEQAKPRNGLQT